MFVASMAYEFEWMTHRICATSNVRVSITDKQIDCQAMGSDISQIDNNIIIMKLGSFEVYRRPVASTHQIEHLLIHYLFAPAWLKFYLLQQNRSFLQFRYWLIETILSITMFCSTGRDDLTALSILNQIPILVGCESIAKILVCFNRRHVNKDPFTQHFFFLPLVIQYLIIISPQLFLHAIFDQSISSILWLIYLFYSENRVNPIAYIARSNWLRNKTHTRTELFGLLKFIFAITQHSSDRRNADAFLVNVMKRRIIIPKKGDIPYNVCWFMVPF